MTRLVFGSVLFVGISLASLATTWLVYRLRRIKLPRRLTVADWASSIGAVAAIAALSVGVAALYEPRAVLTLSLWDGLSRNAHKIPLSDASAEGGLLPAGRSRRFIAIENVGAAPLRNAVSIVRVTPDTVAISCNNDFVAPTGPFWCQADIARDIAPIRESLDPTIVVFDVNVPANVKTVTIEFEIEAENYTTTSHKVTFTVEQ
jgi:hypothetical protein